MIRWRLGNTTFTVEFSFFAVAAVAALWGGGRYVLLLFLAGLLHELGHLAAMGLFHRSVRSVALCGAGTLFSKLDRVPKEAVDELLGITLSDTND